MPCRSATCSAKAQKQKNPFPTVDAVILTGGGIILVRRKNPPHGWALPGGFVEVGESLEESARREAFEETGLKITLQEQFHTYSDPARDARMHTITTVYIASAEGEPRGGDDAAEAKVFPLGELPSPLCFDHSRIIGDVKRYLKTGKRPK